MTINFWQFSTLWNKYLVSLKAQKWFPKPIIIISKGRYLSHRWLKLTLKIRHVYVHLDTIADVSLGLSSDKWSLIAAVELPSLDVNFEQKNCHKKMNINNSDQSTQICTTNHLSERLLFEQVFYSNNQLITGAFFVRLFRLCYIMFRKI